MEQMTTHGTGRTIARTVAVAALTLTSVAVASSPALLARASTQATVAPASATCGAKGQVGTVDNVAKGLRIKHRRKTNNARKGTRILKGDLLETRSGQKASATICGGGTVYLNQKSAAVFSSRNEVRAQHGEVAENTAKNANQSLRTRDATARGSGAYFEVKAQSSQSVYVVARGTVEVRNARGRVQLTENHQTAVKPNRAPEAPKPVDAQKVINWTAPLVESWKVVTASGALEGPQRIALDSQGNIYVTDRGISDSRVVKFSPNGKQLAVWRLQGSHQIAYGIAINSQDTVFVVDSGDDTVQSFTTSGQFLSTFGKLGLDPGDLFDASGLALDRQGNLYVTQAGKFPIQKFSPAGALLATIGTEGNGPGQFEWPNGLALDAQGNMYVADSTVANNRIQKLSPGGQSLAIWGSTGTAPGQFKGPQDVALDASGNIYVTDSVNARIQELSPAGQPIRVFGQLGLSKPGELNGPNGIAIDSHGNILVVDQGNKRIQEFVRSPS